MPAQRTTREEWIEAGLNALARGGADSVRVESLARDLGVTKGGFYGYFADREQLLTEMLDAWEQALLLQPMSVVDAEPGDGRRKLRRLFALASETGANLLDAELAIRNWARTDERVAARVIRIDNQRSTYLRRLFAGFCPDPRDIEGRCHLVLTLFVGNHFVASEHPGLTRSAVIAAATEHLLRDGSDPTPPWRKAASTTPR